MLGNIVEAPSCLPNQNRIPQVAGLWLKPITKLLTRVEQHSSTLLGYSLTGAHHKSQPDATRHPLRQHCCLTGHEALILLRKLHTILWFALCEPTGSPICIIPLLSKQAMRQEALECCSGSKLDPPPRLKEAPLMEAWCVHELCFDY